MKMNDLSGKKFGRLTVINRTEASGTNVGVYWNCLCDCGKHRIVQGQSMVRGDTRSCGCYKKSVEFKGVRTHGKSGTLMYDVWISMKARCYRITCKDYHNYGGRGIIVCDEWKNDFQVFYDWAMASGYKEHLTIERTDNNGNYEPSNCCWIENKYQGKNRRNSRRYTYNGDTEVLSFFSEKYNLNIYTLIGRINKHKWDIKRAIEEPPVKGKNQYGIKRLPN